VEFLPESGDDGRVLEGLRREENISELCRREGIAAAPQVNHDEFATTGHFDQESQKVDAYWKAHLSQKGSN